VDLIVEAFRALPDRQLVVIGDGPQMARVRRLAGPNVRLLGHQPFPELLRWLRGAAAYLFAAVEDFGIAPLEAQAAGTPVIAFAGGALPETVPGLDAEAPCGVLYDEQSPAGLTAGIRAFEAARERVTRAACRRNAERFGPTRFRDELARFVDREWGAFADRRAQTGGASRAPGPPPAAP
jgi:glycosyltransferase involved in cell wall biosynthesis